MGILTEQMISSYYERFKGIEVTFTKELIQAMGLLTEQVHLKCGSDFWPCVFYATSFQGAKVAANIKSGLLNKLKQANNSVSLRLCFKNMEKGEPVTFFIAGRVKDAIPYKNSDDVSLMTIQFTQRPPDYLIEVVGRVLDANINSTRRKDERIFLTTESQRKIKLLSRETTAFIQKVPRRCILREMSFSSAKVIILGIAKFLIDKDTALRFDFDDPKETLMVRGKFIRSESVEGKSEMVALSVEYDKSQIPMGYKMRINDYFNTVRADNRVPGHSGAETKPAGAAAK